MKNKPNLIMPVSLRRAPVAVSSFLLLLLTVAFFAACKKDKTDSPPPAIPGDELKIGFNANTISRSLVDSVLIVLTREGTRTSLFQRGEWRNDSLVVNMDGLHNGNWTAQISLYARSNDTTGRRYDITTSFKEPLTNGDVSLAGPNGKIADSWRPKVVFRDREKEVSVVVPMDNEIPHFEVLVKETKWDKFYMWREANKRIPGTGNELVGEGFWQCVSGCYTYPDLRLIFDSTSFASFSSQLKGKTWDNGFINMIMVDVQTGARKEFFYSYDK